MHSWNLSKWMDALGLRRRDQPDLIYGVQPVEIVGDHSGFSAQVLPPMAWMGNRRTAVALVYSGAQLISRAPGGTYIRWLELATAAANKLRFWINPGTPTVMANVFPAPVVSNMGSSPVLSRWNMGTFAAAPATDVPYFDINTAGGKAFVDMAYIPPGHAFELWQNVVNVELATACLFEDCPAARNAP